MAKNKYVSPRMLQAFLEKLNDKFSKLIHKHAIEDIEDYVVDTELSSTSTNPVQNRVLNEEFETIATAMSLLDSEIDSHTHEEMIRYSKQTLTEEQKLQAQNNIGVGKTIADTLLTMDLIEPLMEDDGEVLVDSNGVLLVTRNEEIFLPKVTDENNGNVLKVVDGKWVTSDIDIPEMPEINYPVTSVNGMTGDVVIEVGSGSCEHVQPDWNQSDESAADYVKNRTHYTTITDKELLPETSFSNDAEENCALIDFVDFSGAKTITATFDGEEYVCPVDGEVSDTDFWYYAGNPALLYGEEEAPDTGEPFYVETNGEIYDGEWDIATIVCAADMSAHTIKIVGAVEGVTKIDLKYLPEGVGYTEVIPAVEIPEMTLTDFSEFNDGLYAVEVYPFELDIVPGTVCNVTWDGTPYEVECLKSEYDDLYMGNEVYYNRMPGGEIPFCLIFGYGELFVITESAEATHTISISVPAAERIHPVDPAYLPPIVGQPGVGENAVVFNNPENQAAGMYSFAEGDGTCAYGESSHAEGSGRLALGLHSHCEGIGETEEKSTWDAAEPSATTYYVGNGNIPWDCDYLVGKYAAANGHVAKIIAADYDASTITLDCSINPDKYYDGPIIIYLNGAFGDHSHAEGNRTIAAGEGSHAEGDFTTAEGKYSHAEGSRTAATGECSHAEGYATLAYGMYSHAEGYMTSASGVYSHAEGTAYAAGTTSHAEGCAKMVKIRGTAESDRYEYVYDYERPYMQNGVWIILPGTNKQVRVVDSGSDATSFRCNGSLDIEPGEELNVYCSNAAGDGSHAEGTDCVAVGSQSHAEGRGTIATGGDQHVQGRYNVPTDYPHPYAHIVGNGTEQKRSNAHTLDWDGNAWYAGTVEATGIILKSSTEGGTKRFKITIDDDGVLTATEIVESAT